MRANDSPQPTPNIDWPLVIFFVASYAIAWGIAVYLAFLAKGIGLAHWTDLLSMAEVMEFNDTALPLPAWSLYALTRVQDFFFSN